jgi:hypothetical protein
MTSCDGPQIIDLMVAETSYSQANMAVVGQGSGLMCFVPLCSNEVRISAYL